MAKSLFDHIKAITNEQDQNYWDKLDESDKKTWSNYMILRFLSMNNDWIVLLSELQPALQELPPKLLYKALINGIIPKGRHFLKYMKASKSEEYEDWIIELVKKYYEVSLKEAEEYYQILHLTKEGHKQIKYIAESFGTDPKKITKLKLKI
jgi:hypothetical protein